MDQDRPNLKNMTMRQRLRWFANYWLLKAVVIGALAVLAAFVLKTVLFPGKIVEGTILVIAPQEGDYSDVEEELGRLLGYDNTDEVIQIDHVSSETAEISTVIPIRLAAGDIDAVIADREMFLRLTGSDAFEDVRALTETDDLPDVKLVEVASADGAEYPAGVSLLGNEFYASCISSLKDPVFGIVKSPDDTEEEKAMLKMVLGSAGPITETEA